MISLPSIFATYFLLCCNSGHDLIPVLIFDYQKVELLRKITIFRENKTKKELYKNNMYRRFNIDNSDKKVLL